MSFGVNLSVTITLYPNAQYVVSLTEKCCYYPGCLTRFPNLQK